jgi:glucan phosphoethanolaminetransferase (alkaline phosphatase superfamily)
MIYYAYYLLSRFAKKFNNRDGDYAFTTIFYLFLLLEANVMTVLLLLFDKAFFSVHIGLIVAISAIIPATGLYFGLVRNKKYLEVIKEYDEKYSNTPINNRAVALLVFYILVTFTLIIYMANVVRAQSI